MRSSFATLAGSYTLIESTAKLQPDGHLSPIIERRKKSRPGSGSQPAASRLVKYERFHSAFLPDDRDLVVYLPPGYDRETSRRYPTLYLQDGQNLFDPETAFVKGMDWKVGETADRLITAREIEPLIIVGIYNTGLHRIDEYTPTRDPKQGGGQADLYGRLLVEELKPFLDSEYRTLAGANHAGLGGSSLGGLVSLYIGLRYPHIFGNVAAMSPSVWWDNRIILKQVRRLTAQARPHIYLDIGTAEGAPALRGARLLRSALIDKGWLEGRDLDYNEAKGAGHNEAAWTQRVAPMLRFLFPKGKEARVFPSRAPATLRR